MSSQYLHLGLALTSSQGLGKTLQTISFLGFLKFQQGTAGPHLIVVPKSTLNNWAREVEKWVPGFRTTVLQGTKEDRVSYTPTIWNSVEGVTLT
jgi:SNF2 family DNA or RNA helicase